MCTYHEETAVSLTVAPRRPARRTRLTAAAIALPLGLGAVLSGCSAGQITQTAEKRPAVEGAQAEIGELKVLNAHFVAPGDEGKYESGDTVELELVVTTLGAADEITGIEVDGAAAQITPNSTIEVPADGMVVIGDNGEAKVEATMTDEVYPSALIPVVITFQDAGELTFEVPIAASLEEIPRDPEQVYTPQEGEGGGH